MERDPTLDTMHEKESSQRMRGWTLPTTLFALALLLSSVHLLTFESIDARHMIAEYMSGERQHQDVLSEIKVGLSARSRCSDVTISNETSHPVYEVCREELLPFTSVPPSIIEPALVVDYDALFLTASMCPTTPLPTELRFRGVPLARYDCILPAALRNGAALLENIRGGVVTVSPPSAGIGVLASPGSVSVSGELTISGDLLIVTGGDVAIGAIRGTGGTTAKVTIISSRGGITVNKVFGAVSLLIASRAALVAPETPRSTSYPLPPVRAASLYGFRVVPRNGG